MQDIFVKTINIGTPRIVSAAVLKIIEQFVYTVILLKHAD